MAKKIRKVKTCHKCSKKYVGWRCNWCYGGKKGGDSGVSLFKRIGAAAYLYTPSEFDTISVESDAAPKQDDKLEEL